MWLRLPRLHPTQAICEREFAYDEGLRKMKARGEGRFWMPSEVQSLEESWQVNSPEPKRSLPAPKAPDRP